jgi:hypothetical protein
MVGNIISLFLKLFLLVFVYLFFLGTTYSDLSKAYRMRHWEKVSGKIKNVFIERDTNNQYVSKKYINTFVSYSYESNGNSFSNTELAQYHTLYQTKYSDQTIEEDQKKKYGETIPVYCNPENISEATIRPAKNVDAVILWACPGLLAIFFILRSIYRQFRYK